MLCFVRVGGLIPVITDSVTLKGLTFNIHIFCKIVFIDIIGTSTEWIDQDIIFNNIPKTTYSHRIKLFREIKDCTISTRNYNNVIYANIPNNKSFGDSQNGYYQDLYVI